MSKDGCTLTPAQRKALQRASERDRGTVCPIQGVWGGAEDALLNALSDRGLIYFEPKGVPRISDAGRAALSRAKAEKE